MTAVHIESATPTSELEHAPGVVGHKLETLGARIMGTVLAFYGLAVLAEVVKAYLLA